MTMLRGASFLEMKLTSIDINIATTCLRHTGLYGLIVSLILNAKTNGASC